TLYRKNHPSDVTGHSGREAEARNEHRAAAQEGINGVLAATSVSPTLAQPSSASVRATQVFGLPMQFEKNAGQTDHQVEFLARGLGYTLFLTPTQAVFSLSSVRSSAAGEKRAGQHNHR